MLILAGGAAVAAALGPAMGRPGAPPPSGLGRVQTPPRAAPSGGAPTEAQDQGPLRLEARLDAGFARWGHDDDRYLVVEISAPETRSARRPPVHLSLVVDGSGSMKSDGKIAYARLAAAALVDRLGAGDTLSLVRFADGAETVAPQGGLEQRALLHRQIKALPARGGTNLYEGLQVGRAELWRAPAVGVRRMVLLSDGYPTAGLTEPAALIALAEQAAAESIGLSTMGVGLEFNEDLLAGLADAGGGRYHYVNDPNRLAQMFSEELAVAGSLVGQGLRLELDLHGARALEVYGYTPRPGEAPGRLSVALGDLHAGETRRLVLRLDVPEDALGEQTIASLQLRYAEADGRPAASARRVQQWVTEDASLVEASVDRGLQAQAAKARSGALLHDGAAAWARGDLVTNQARLAEASALLGAAGGWANDPSLVEAAAAVEAQRRVFLAAPAASAEGQDVLKRSKEAARVYSR